MLLRSMGAVLGWCGSSVVGVGRGAGPSTAVEPTRRRGGGSFSSTPRRLTAARITPTTASYTPTSKNNAVVIATPNTSKCRARRNEPSARPRRPTTTATATPAPMSFT